MTTNDNIREVLDHWGLRDATVTLIKSRSQSVWDIGGEYILKRYINADAVSQGIRLSELLTPHKIPVPVFIPTKKGQLTSPDGLYCLMSKLPGKYGDFFNEPGFAIEMGRALARLHKALAVIEPEISCNDSDLLADWQLRIKPSLYDVSDYVVQSVDNKFRDVYPKLPRQLIHRDVHAANVLFDGGRLTAWLDFDIGQRNVRIFDIAYFLSGLLIGNLNDLDKIERWRLIYFDLLKGYSEISPLTDDESEALPVLMIVIEFLFVWFWDKQGDQKQRGIARELGEWLYAS